MNPCGRDPTLSEVLADPMVRAVMAADRVDPRALATELREMAAALNPSDRPSVSLGQARSHEHPRNLRN